MDLYQELILEHAKRPHGAGKESVVPPDSG